MDKNKVISVSVSEGFLRHVDKFCEQEGYSRSRFLEKAASRYMTEIMKETFIPEVLEETREKEVVALQDKLKTINKAGLTKKRGEMDGDNYL
jgi:metal-responsive CopG/Arc/MetJ family transcriptional regulator